MTTGRPSCICSHRANRHAAPAESIFTHRPLPTRCLEYECECQEYRPPHPRAVYRDGAAADSAGRMSRLVRMVEEGRFA